MLIATHKKLCWFLLAMGVGGTLLFIAILAEEGPPLPQEQEWWLWPICTIIAAIVALLRLRRLYRLELAQQPGLYHLSLIDLLVATLLAGLTGTIFHWAHFAAGTMVLVPFVAVAFTFGVLISTRRGFKSIGWKYLYAIAYLTYIFGLADMAGFVVLVVGVILTGNAPNVLSDILSFEHSRFTWLAWLLRASFVALPAGWFVCRWLEKKRNASGRKL